MTSWISPKILRMRRLAVLPWIALVAMSVICPQVATEARMGSRQNVVPGNPRNGRTKRRKKADRMNLRRPSASETTTLYPYGALRDGAPCPEKLW